MTPSPTLTVSITPSQTGTSTSTATPSPTPLPFAMVDSAFAYIYPGIATYLPFIAGFSQDTNLRVLGITPDNEWLLVEIAPSQTGWIESKSVHLDNPEVLVSTIEPPVPPTLTPTAVARPRVSVRDKATLDFYNFQPHENLTVTLSKNGQPPRKFSASTGDNGFATILVANGGILFENGETYSIVVTGNKGSYLEKTFTYSG